MADLLKHIDTKIAGAAVISAKINLSSFVAGFVQRIINTSEYSTLSYEIQGQISHLSFLVHLVCRNNNFDVIYEEHESIQNDIDNGLVRWTDQSYFNQWERLMLTKYVGNRLIRPVSYRTVRTWGRKEVGSQKQKKRKRLRRGQKAGRRPYYDVLSGQKVLVMMNCDKRGK